MLTHNHFPDGVEGAVLPTGKTEAVRLLLLLRLIFCGESERKQVTDRMTDDGLGTSDLKTG